MLARKIGFIGGGRITRIFLQAYRNRNLKFEKIIVCDTNQENLEKLEKRYPELITTTEDYSLFKDCEVVFIATHPPVVLETLSRLKEEIDRQTILVSLAPKITIGKMKAVLEDFEAIARVNPSAPGIINEGINPVAVSDGMSDAQQETLFELLGYLGKVMIVNESKIEGYAVISAMGPTYFWFQLHKLKELAVSFGFEENEAKEVITEMLRGTIDTLYNSTIPAEEVMDLVPVRPLSDYEEAIKGYYSEKLNGIFEKIRP